MKTTRLLLFAQGKNPESVFYSGRFPRDLFRIVYKKQRNAELFEQWKREEPSPCIFKKISGYGQQTKYIERKARLVHNLTVPSREIDANSTKVSLFTCNRDGSGGYFDPDELAQGLDDPVDIHAMWAYWSDKGNDLWERKMLRFTESPYYVRNDEEIVLGFYSRDKVRRSAVMPSILIQRFSLISKELRENKAFLRKLIIATPMFFDPIKEILGDEIETDKELCLEMIKVDPCLFLLFDSELQLDFDCCKLAYFYNPQLRNIPNVFSDQQMHEILKQNGCTYDRLCLCNNQIHDKYYILKHIYMCNGHCWNGNDYAADAPDELLTDPDIIYALSGTDAISNAVIEKMRSDKKATIRFLKEHAHDAHENSILTIVEGNKELMQVALENGVLPSFMLAHSGLTIDEVAEHASKYKGEYGPSVYSGVQISAKDAISIVKKCPELGNAMHDDVWESIEFAKVYSRLCPDDERAMRFHGKDAEIVEMTAMQNWELFMDLVDENYLTEDLLHFVAFERHLQRGKKDAIFSHLKKKQKLE